MSNSNLASVLGKLKAAMHKQGATRAKLTSHAKDLADDGEPYTPVGIHGVLASTEKLLAVNRGLVPTDERDSIQYKKTFRTSDLLKERVRLDADKLRRQLTYKAAKSRNLKALHPFYFDPYAERHLVGNPLSSPLEEINPMQLVEQARRVTLMGPGGLGTSQAITEEAQCHSADTEVFTKEGWKKWPSVTENDELAARVDGVLKFLKPSVLVSEPYEGIMYGVKSRSVNFLVSPNHRMFTASSARTENWDWELAKDHYQKYRVYLATSEPYEGTDKSEYFNLPAVDIDPQGYNLRTIPPIDMGDWCEFMGWYLSEGSCYNGASANKYTVTISQCETANPVKTQIIKDLLDRMPFIFNRKGVNFRTKSKYLYSYLEQFGKAADKFLPDFLFEVAPHHRRRFLQAFLLGDGHSKNGKTNIYSSCSERMVTDIERLLISVGASTSRTKPWKAKNRAGDFSCWMYAVTESCCPIKEIKPVNHFVEPYKGLIYCATITGGMLLTRRGGTAIWSGNSLHPSTFGFLSSIEGPESEKIGIDSRVAWGAKIGSNGRIYQKYWDNRIGKNRYMNAEDLDGLIVKLPD